jgi:NAD(P)-dependent dehydrogenase (short-subunit alcohol dehydrogenase family)
MNTPFHLNGRRILITGASSGIGRQTAISISKMGGSCILTSRNEEELRKTKSMLESGDHMVIPADLTKDDERLSVSMQCGKLDGLAYCAGNVKSFPIRFLNQSYIDGMMHLNFNAPVLLTAQLLKNKNINNNAALVYISSISSKFPPKGGSMYGSSKAALESFVITLAKECAGNKIRANSISPGMVRTPLYDRAEEAISKEEMDAHMQRYPLGAGEPEDVANMCVFLLSEASKWITGTNIIMDGGFLTGSNQ